MSHLAEDLHRVALWLDGHRGDLVDEVIDHTIREVPEYYGAVDPSLSRLAREATEMVLRDLAAGLDDGPSVTTDPPPQSVAEARLAARKGVSWSAFVRACNLITSRWWERLYAEISAWELPAERTHPLILVMTRYLFEFVDVQTTALERTYLAELDRAARSRDRRTTALVHQVLHGGPVADEDLGYALGAQHVGLVAWGAEPDRAVAELAGRMAAPIVSTASDTEMAVWAWIGLRADSPNGSRELRSYAPPADTFLALGAPAAGPEGFRRTHREAMRAFQVGLTGGRPVTFLADVQLESMALQDEQFAREFARDELGALADEGNERAATLRRTLRAYFATGNNGAAAAASLGVHERTVGYRLATIEKLLGHTILARRDQLALALRIHDLFGGEATASQSAPTPPAVPPRQRLRRVS